MSDVTEVMLEAAKANLPTGYAIVPLEPTEAMWGGLARDIVMWAKWPPHTGASLHQHLRSLRPHPTPEWLLKEIPDTDHTPPKGTIAACIYKAMIEASTPTPSP